MSWFSMRLSLIVKNLVFVIRIIIRIELSLLNLLNDLSIHSNPLFVLFFFYLLRIKQILFFSKIFNPFSSRLTFIVEVFPSHSEILVLFHFKFFENLIRNLTFNFRNKSRFQILEYFSIDQIIDSWSF